MNDAITEKKLPVYRVLGENYLTLYAACYRLAKHQLVPDWFEQEAGICKKDEHGKTIPHWSLHRILTSSGDAVPVESEDEYVKYKEHCGFDSEKWVSMKRERAKQLAEAYRKAKTAE